MNSLEYGANWLKVGKRCQIIIKINHFDNINSILANSILLKTIRTKSFKNLGDMSSYDFVYFIMTWY